MEENVNNGYYKYGNEKAIEGMSKLGITVNSRGFRGSEFTSPKPSHIYRVFCTGGSSTFSSECPDGQSYPEQLGVTLNKKFHPDKCFEVINAGFEGFKVANVLELFRQELIDYQPDCLTVCEAFNDLEQNTMQLDSFWKQFFWQGHRTLFQRSIFYSDLILWLGRRGQNSAALAASLSHRLASYASTLGAIHDESEKAGVTLVFILQPILPICVADKIATGETGGWTEKAFLEKEYIDAVGTHHAAFLSVMERVARERSIVLMDPRSAFNNHPDLLELFADYIHLSPAGSRLLAEEIARVFNREKIGLSGPLCDSLGDSNSTSRNESVKISPNLFKRERSVSGGTN